MCYLRELGVIKTFSLTIKQRILKRFFDFSFSFILIPFCLVPIILLILFATLDTKQFGLFFQKRVGRNGKLFSIFKVRTFNSDMKVSSFGRFLRKSKLDELPQLFNVLIGDMSFVGPRPDMEDHLSTLKGDDRIILTVKPGITGPASIKYRNEEKILKGYDNPEEHSKKVIWPDKVAMNKKYILEYRFLNDLKYLLKTITS